MTRDERMAKIRGTRWIRYAEQIGAKLDELLRLPKTHRMPNLLIVAETNNGKTALISHFVHQHPAQLSAPRTISRIPVMAVQAPPVPDERRFYQAILTLAYAPFRPSHNVAQLQSEALRLLATLKVRLLIIDEIHHLLGGPLLRQRSFLNVIKYLGNELQIPIVAAGTDDAFNAIQTDPQLGLPAAAGQLRGCPAARRAFGAARAGVGDQNLDPLGRHDWRDLSAALSGGLAGH